MQHFISLDHEVMILVVNIKTVAVSFITQNMSIHIQLSHNNKLYLKEKIKE